MSKRQRGGSTGEAKARRQARGHTPKAQLDDKRWERRGSGHDAKRAKKKGGGRKKR
ncbi:MAG: hypothetical protein OEV37_04060 [Candidatus Berkelbacteria bacterium]|nr:hypothetical protein [Candidatus Berkelbacteria bacterium]